MAAVLQRVKIGSVGALPSQGHSVGVVGIAHLGVGGQGGGVGDPHGAITVTALDAVGVNRGRFVDLAQTGFGHLDGHRVLHVIINHGELAGILAPGSDLVGAASIAEELDNHVVLVVANTLAQSIHIGVLAQGRSLRGDGRQVADDLVLCCIFCWIGRLCFLEL